MNGKNLGDIRQQVKAANKPTTNADRIRAMSDEELAAWIAELSDCETCKCDAKHPKHPKCWVNDETCASTWLDWLKEEVE